MGLNIIIILVSPIVRAYRTPRSRACLAPSVRRRPHAAEPPASRVALLVARPRHGSPPGPPHGATRAPSRAPRSAVCPPAFPRHPRGVPPPTYRLSVILRCSAFLRSSFLGRPPFGELTFSHYIAQVARAGRVGVAWVFRWSRSVPPRPARLASEPCVSGRLWGSASVLI